MVLVFICLTLSAERIADANLIKGNISSRISKFGLDFEQTASFDLKVDLELYLSDKADLEFGVEKLLDT